MANWDELRTRVERTATKVVKKTEELADITAKYVKLKTLDSKISSRFESLGRLTYKQIKDEVSQAEKISRVIDDIDTLRVERRALKEEIEADRQRRAAEKNATKKESTDTEANTANEE